MLSSHKAGSFCAVTFVCKLVMYCRHVSFVDCPGRNIFMATMLNGAAVMDAALLLIQCRCVLCWKIIVVSWVCALLECLYQVMGCYSSSNFHINNCLTLPHSHYLGAWVSLLLARIAPLVRDHSKENLNPKRMFNKFKHGSVWKDESTYRCIKFWTVLVVLLLALLYVSLILFLILDQNNFWIILLGM